jgi:phage terminase small subunit
MVGDMTARQKRFVEEYLIDLNATQAAIRAGYSVRTAKQIATENLSKPIIEAAIGREMAIRSKRTGVTADRVITELAKLGFVNIGDVADFDRATVQEGANRDDTAAIQAIKVKRTPTDDGTIIERELKLHDKVKSLDLLGRHLGMWNDRLKLDGGLQIEFTGEGNLPE